MDFVPSVSVLLAFTLASLVLTITPGPDMVLFLGKTLAQGKRAGLMAMLGAFSGTLAHTLLAAFGLSALLMNSATAFGVLKLVGALYLLWLALDAIRNGSALNLDRMRPQPEAGLQLYLKGVGVNLTNPKIVLFFVTFLPQFVSAADPSAPAKLFFLGLYFIAIAFPLCALMILTADRIAGAAKRSPRAVRVVDWLFASVFAGFAVRLLLEPGRG